MKYCFYKRKKLFLWKISKMVAKIIILSMFFTSCCSTKLVDRVETSLQVDLKRVGTIKPRDTRQIESSRITIGCETLDRDYTDFSAYREYLQPLGIKKARLQGGWAKTEKEKGVYDFKWLDDIIDYLVSVEMIPWVQFGFGNPIYEGGGSIERAGGIPVSDEALAAWDKWVEMMVVRYKDRVNEWEIWNEPNLNSTETPEKCAELNIRTAEIVKRIQPEAKIAGLVMSGDSENYLDNFLKIISDANKLDLFTWITYHSYKMIPENSYAGIEKLNAKLSKYSSKILLRSGEHGALSGYCPSFALSNYYWTEYTQAKWNLRACLGDLGRDIETQVFCIIDVAYLGGRWGDGILNIKGLIQSDLTKIAIRRKVAYYSMQHLASIFDNMLECTPDFKYTTDASESVSVFGFRNTKTQQQLVALWFDSAIPNNSFVTKDVTVTVENGNFKKPVWVDMLSGQIYEIPASKYMKDGTKYTFTVPVYDSPVLIADTALIPH